MDTIVCKMCGKQYDYEVWGNVYPGGKQRETKKFPYCGDVGYSEMTSQNILSYKLDKNGNPIKREVF